MNGEEEKGSAKQGSRKPRWDYSERRELANCRIFSLVNYEARSPRSGRQVTFHVLECPQWVNIIPVTRERNVVLIRQFRAGTRTQTLEIPGGMVDPGDPDPKAAARREMLEETGYDAPSIEFLGKIHPNPAIQDNLCHSFLARDAYRLGEQNLDAGEEVEPVLVPLAQVPALIRTGQISHALVVVAFTFMFGLAEEFTEC